MEKRACIPPEIGMQFVSAALLSCILLCSVFVSVFCESNDGKCESVVNGPFDICTTAGNYTLPIPKKITTSEKTEFGWFIKSMITAWNNCSKYNVAAVIQCSYWFPKCSSGKRVLPCRRVCGEFLKQCMNKVSDHSDVYLDYTLSLCLSLPDEIPSDDKCLEPPNFSTDESVPSEYPNSTVEINNNELITTLCSADRCRRPIFRGKI